MVRYEELRIALRAQRKLLGLTQRAVAQKMGIAPTALNMLELGKSPNPTCETLATWARALGGYLRIDVEFADIWETAGR